MYNPLPDNIKLQPSNIHGYGVFAKCDIPKDSILGISHVANDNFPNGWIRTPLGGFYNHSERPNCKLQEKILNGNVVKVLKTVVDVKAGFEITCKYTIWKATEEIKKSHRATWLGL